MSTATASTAAAGSAATAATVTEIGKQLVALCREQRNLEAIEQFYSPDIVSIEVCGDENMPRRMEGIEAIKGKNRWWFENMEVHGASAEGPFPHDDRFIVLFKSDVTCKTGPMAGKRMQISEAGLYTVKDGKIVREEFFYDMTGCA